ncbi:alpha/beta fold hydrolase [Pedobacter rhodius]|uniref:Alpha/beta hydrolase n=1 Tax=Pedobacter rhodius TaxID=3004098 RepID=A0ABT4KTQ7_9SPHI|nr:alpha/beta hydrolase [Pedobacter sp. SJ11]MCZ4222300.1 alpha/beta hydrolase [Pedobacter sp. SJ11]
MNVYFISGLGADKRIFSKIKLDNKLNIIHLNWIAFHKNESLKNYAERLSKSIDQSKPFSLVGVSFGGMIAVELAKLLEPKVTIIISSTLLSKHLPFIYRLAGKLGLIKIVPANILKSSNSIIQNYFFGTKLKEERELLKNIIEDTDAHFLKWAIGSILSWKNNTKPKKLFQIHGTNDKILYTNKVEPDFSIKGGTHFMVYQKANEISALISKLILDEKITTLR